jgi:hypothetical protein
MPKTESFLIRAPLFKAPSTGTENFKDLKRFERTERFKLKYEIVLTAFESYGELHQSF